MPGKQLARIGASDMIAERHEILDETKGAIETSETTPDRCAVEASTTGCAAADLLGEAADGLILAYRAARDEGDPRTIALVERALVHVAHRLAEGMTPEEAGLVCH